MKSPIITPVIFLFTLLPFIWLILVICSSPITTTLQVARLYDANGKALIDMGVLGGCAKAFDQLEEVENDTHGVDCQRKAPGWRVRPFFPYSDPIEPGRGSGQHEIIRGEDTFPLLMIPIVTGMVGIVLVLLIAAWTGGSRKWARTLHVTNFSFYVVTTIVAWVAFGMCIRVSTIINGNLKLYNEGGGLDSLGTPSLAVPLEAKHGNATWLALSSSTFGKRAPAEQDQYNLQAAKPFVDDQSTA